MIILQMFDDWSKKFGWDAVHWHRYGVVASYDQNIPDRPRNTWGLERIRVRRMCLRWRAGLEISRVRTGA